MLYICFTEVSFSVVRADKRALICLMPIIAYIKYFAGAAVPPATPLRFSKNTAILSAGM